MSEKFTASNGDTVEIKNETQVVLRPADGDPFGSVNVVQTLREFFLHERDQELGRWRCNGHLVAYARAEYPSYSHKGRSVMILDERDGRLIERWERDNTPDEWTDAAESYFSAHPVPKPWHEAKPEEAWLVTVNGDEGVFLAHRNYFDGSVNLTASNGTTVNSTDDEQITAGRRIWPEVPCE